MTLEAGFAEQGSRIRREVRLSRSARKKGGRLTSDPIRTSLGLLPSGPDPVGEWLVHRQSPGPYLGPKAAESKRSWPHTHRHPEEPRPCAASRRMAAGTGPCGHPSRLAASRRAPQDDGGVGGTIAKL